MAGLDWIQVDSGFSSSLAVMCASDVLGMDARTFTGAMVDLQDWAVRNLPSGRFSALSASTGRVSDVSADERLWRKSLERVVRWDGAPGAFWDALVHVGLLVWEDDTVRLTLCDRYVQVLEKRARDAERKRRERAAKNGSASAGRPADSFGTSPTRKRKEKENEKKIPSAAAALEDLGTTSGRLMTTRLPTETPSAAADLPVQRSLPGMHLVPASPPSDERLLAAAAALSPPGAEFSEPRGAPPSPSDPLSQALAFFEAFQDERGRAFPGVPREEPPSTWSDWYQQALGQVGGDEGRLLEACRAYLSSDWGRARQPAGTSRAFCSPKVWVRYVAPLACPMPSAPHLTSGGAEPSTEAGRRWRDCLAYLHEDGRRYAVTWLAQARPIALKDGVLVLEAPNSYMGQWLREHYGPLLERAARQFALAGIRWHSPAEVRSSVESA